MLRSVLFIATLPSSGGRQKLPACRWARAIPINGACNPANGQAPQNLNMWAMLSADDSPIAICRTPDIVKPKKGFPAGWHLSFAEANDAGAFTYSTNASSNDRFLVTMGDEGDEIIPSTPIDLANVVSPGIVAALGGSTTINPLKGQKSIIITNQGPASVAITPNRGEAFALGYPLAAGQSITLDTGGPVFLVADAGLPPTINFILLA